MPPVEDRSMDIWIGENIFKIPGIGYYAPPHPKATHAEMVLCANYEEAEKLTLAAYPTPAPHGHASGREMADDISLCFYREGWGPIVVPNFSDSLYDAHQVINRMLATNMLSFGCWKTHSFSSVCQGWVVSFRNSVHPPEYTNPDTHPEMQWYGQDQRLEMAICKAAKAVYEDLDDSFRIGILGNLAKEKGVVYAD